MTTENGRPFKGIKEIRIKNYRSLRGVSIPVEPLTVFVGPNGSGKSNILRSLGFVRRALRVPPNLMRRSLRASVWRSGDGHLAETMGISLSLSLRNADGGPVEAYYGFEYDATTPIVRVHRERCVVRGERTLFYDRTRQETKHNLGFGLPDLKPEALALPLFSRIGDFGLVQDALSDSRLYAISPESIQESPIAEPPYSSLLSSDGSNLVDVLAYLRANDPVIYERIGDHLSSVVPGTVLSLEDWNEKIFLRFDQVTEAGLLHLNASQMSDGTLRVLGMLTAVYQRPSPFLIALEEPESTIHPSALPVLLDILAVGAESSQLLVTTHNPDVLDWQALPLDSVKLVQWKDGQTLVSPIGKAARLMTETGRMSLGELMRSNALVADPSDQEDVDLFPELM